MNRKAVSGAISGIFIVLIFFIAIAAIMTYHEMQDKYNETVNERNRLEWERLNEKITIPNAVREDDGTMNATLQNVGGLPAHLVSLWLTAYNASNAPKWQRQHKIDLWMGSGETKHNFGQDIFSYALIKPGLASEILTSIELANEDWIYAVKVVTERGNIATYIIRPEEPPEVLIRGGQEVPMTITWNQESFEFRTESLDIWTPAWEIDTSSPSFSKQKVVFRLNLTNRTEDDIELREYSYLTLSDVELGNFAVKEYYILQPGSTPDLWSGFVSQTIPAGEWRYVYFGATIAGGDNLQALPSESSYVIFTGMSFNYAGETLYYGLVISVMMMRIY